MEDRKFHQLLQRDSVVKLVLLIVLSLGALLIHGAYVGVARPLVAFMDSLRGFGWVEDLLAGNISWADTWQYGDHRGYWVQFITLIQCGLYGESARITTRLTGVVLCATGFLWAWSLPITRVRDRAFYVNLAAAAAGFVLLLSPANFELLTLSVGFPQILKNFLLVGYFYLLQRSVDVGMRVPRAFALSVVGVVLVFVVTMGWGYPFVGAVLLLALFGVWAGDRRAIGFVPVALTLLVGLAVFTLLGNSFMAGGHVASTVSIGSLFLLIVGGFFVGIGSVVINLESLLSYGLPVAVMGAVGVVVFLTFLFLVSLSKGSRKPDYFSIGLGLYALLAVFAVAVSRSGGGVTAAAASRYYPDDVLLLFAILGMVVRNPGLLETAQLKFGAHSVSVRYLRWCMGALVVMLIVGQSATWLREFGAAPYRANAFSRMADVYVLGVESQQDADLLQAPIGDAIRGVAAAQRYSWAGVRDLSRECTLDSAYRAGDWFAPENGVIWMGRRGGLVLGGCQRGATLSGYLPPGMSDRTITVTVNGVRRAPLSVHAGNPFLIDLRQDVKTYSTIVAIELDKVESPKERGLNGDERKLGVLFTKVEEGAK